MQGAADQAGDCKQLLGVLHFLTPSIQLWHGARAGALFFTNFTSMPPRERYASWDRHFQQLKR